MTVQLRQFAVSAAMMTAIVLVAAIELDAKERDLPEFLREKATHQVRATEPPSLWKLAEGLALCLGVLSLGVYVLQKIHGKRGVVATDATLAIVEKIPLNSKISLVVVRCRGEELLCSLSSEGVNLLKSLEKREEDSAAGQKQETDKFKEELWLAQQHASC